MKQKNIKLLKYKLSVYLLLSLSFLSPMNKNRKCEKESISNYIHKLSYSEGYLYVLSSNTTIHSNDLIVIDERHTKDANIKIIDSYKIKDEEQMKEIINILIEYNELNNVYGWNRTKESMYNEWVIHNICYNLGIRVKRSKDVDFNNNDEKIYSRCKILNLTN